MKLRKLATSVRVLIRDTVRWWFYFGRHFQAPGIFEPTLNPEQISLKALFSRPSSRCDYLTLHSSIPVIDLKRVNVYVHKMLLIVLFEIYGGMGTYFSKFPCFGLLLLLFSLLQSSTYFNTMHAAFISILKVDNLWGN